jgi:hypothetical protein
VNRNVNEHDFAVYLTPEPAMTCAVMPVQNKSMCQQDINNIPSCAFQAGHGMS